MTDTAPQWHPISTAPKDGTKIFVFRDGWDGAYIACWGKGTWGLDDQDLDVELFGWSFDDEMFCRGHEDCFLGWEDDPMPTHWMPLPAPPAATEKGLV